MLTVKKIGEFNCYTYFPDNFDEKKKYPVILFLHGAGTRGNDIEMVRTNAGFVHVCDYENEKKNQEIVIAPQCTGQDWFEFMQDLIALAETVSKMPFIDSNRFYLCGTSMGGYATWELAILRPELFAAIMPVCGGGASWNCGRLKMPVYAFHGLLDQVVSPSESIRMVNSVNRNGGHAKITVYEDKEHNCWDAAYTDIAALDRFTSNIKGKSNVNDETLDQKTFG